MGQQLVKEKLRKLIEYCWLREIRIDEETEDFCDFFTSLEDQGEIAADNIGLLKDFSEKILKSKRVKEYLEDYESEPVFWEFCFYLYSHHLFCYFSCRRCSLVLTCCRVNLVLHIEQA